MAEKEESAKNCGSCKHWLPPEERTDFATAVRASYDISEQAFDKVERLADKMDKKFGICQGIYEGVYEIGTAKDPMPIALSVDGSDYMSKIMTQQSFGCVLHEEKGNG